MKKELQSMVICGTITRDFDKSKGVAYTVEIVRNAFAGTMESSDAYVEITPAQSLQVQLESVVKAQFGQQIEDVVQEVLRENSVERASVRVIDRGALECVIRARVETAICRGREEV